MEEIKGVVASGEGKVSGKVRILEDSNSDLEEGEILVTQMTNPTFFSQIIKAKAIVTDLGGILCHAAILARELGKPCIVGTENATKVLKNGDGVIVDLENGKIKKIS